MFDHQIEIARQLKLKAKPGMAPSDLLMRRYYLAAKAIWRFNQILLANLFARITPRSERKTTQARRRLPGGRRDARDPQTSACSSAAPG